MKKEIKILISTLVVIILLAILLVVLNEFFFKDNATKVEENKQEPEQEEKYKEPVTKQKKLKAITTKDKKISISDTTAYFRDGISEVMLDIESTESYQELYLTLEFRENGNLIDTSVVYATDVKKDENFKYLIQSQNDLTKTKSWSVSIVDQQIASNSGFQGTVD